MARYGFSGGETELKIALLYMLRRAEFRPSSAELTEIVFIDENMNYFQYCEALSSLCENKQVLESEGRYQITKEGASNADIMEHELPISLRRAIDKRLLPYNERARRDACLHMEVLTRRGEVYALCTLSDGDRPICKLELLAAGQEQAEVLCEKFRQNAESVYEQIMHMLG